MSLTYPKGATEANETAGTAVQRLPTSVQEPSGVGLALVHQVTAFLDRGLFTSISPRFNRRLTSFSC